MEEIKKTINNITHMFDYTDNDLYTWSKLSEALHVYLNNQVKDEKLTDFFVWCDEYNNNLNSNLINVAIELHNENDYEEYTINIPAEVV